MTYSFPPHLFITGAADVVNVFIAPFPVPTLFVANATKLISLLFGREVISEEKLPVTLLIVTVFLVMPVPPDSNSERVNSVPPVLYPQ